MTAAVLVCANFLVFREGIFHVGSAEVTPEVWTAPASDQLAD
jgi:hypothetical protein